ncbi:hypothetical protein TBR22_A24290 [Luteitalea sp. TBR-22]|uniref:phosphotransferase n=1 Tax=Luteitalea sp. TBR-22 TaxID=2802971 RepID=UPI001AF4BE28|nr:phosphotransferase [Luteitalea sp. TBR-22]BCS33202.1 hypothetical protein TBR22_A24290 [Luteitalea sp. TBR-22]
MQPLAPGAPAPAVFAPVLDRLRTETPALFGDDARLVPVAYEARPFSHILRLGLHRGALDHPSSYCFLKIFKPKPVPDGEVLMRQRVVHDFETTRRIHQALSAVPGCGAVRPIVCYPDLLASMTEEASGQTLLAVLESEAAWFPGVERLAAMRETMARTGRWLRAFQTIDPGDDHATVGELRDYIDIRLTRLVEAGSRIVTGQRRHALLRRIEELGARLPPSALRRVPIHADLAPGNVLVDGDRIVVLDFAMASRGTTMHDLARLYVQTDLLRAKPQFRRTIVEALLQALLEGFAPGLTNADPLFRLLSLQHRINHLGTLTLQQARFPTNLYNRRLRGFHARWLERELQIGA